MAQADAILMRARRDPAVLAASFTANLLALAIPISMIHIYDRVIPNEGYATLAALGIMVVVALAAELALRAARHHLIAIAAEKFEVDVSVAAMEALLLADPARATQESEGQIYRRISSIDRLRALHSGDTAMAILDLPFAILFLAVIVLISPMAGISVFALLGAAFVALRVARAKVLRLQLDRQDIEARRHSFVSETLRGIDAIKNLQIDQQMQRRYEKLLSGSAEKSASLTQALHTAQGITAGVGTLAPLLIASVGAYLVIQEEISIGALAAIVLLTGRIVQPILRVEAFLAGEESLKQAREDVNELLQTPRKRSGIEKPKSIGTFTVMFNKMEEVGGSKNVLFQDVSLSLKRGDFISVAGATDAEKSSFLRLLAGEAATPEGSIRVNGICIDDLDYDFRHRKIRLLTKDDVLLSGTILENMTAFDPNSLGERATELARDLGIEDFFLQSPEGFALEVGRGGGDRLPKSLADAVSLVGGLVTDPDVLIFDQANVALDVDTDQRLRALLKKQAPHRITILSSNRPSFQTLASHVIDLSAHIMTSDRPAGRA